MKREYFGMLFIAVTLIIIFLLDYLFGQEKVLDYLGKFVFVWLILGFYVGQYSMRFPKAF